MELREFRVTYMGPRFEEMGTTVMAYSKNDAINKVRKLLNVVVIKAFLVKEDA